MRICFLAPADNYHTIKWAKWFSERKHEVHVISFFEGEIPNVSVHVMDVGVKAKDSDLKKLRYLFMSRAIKRELRRINPEIIHAHYATSYGAVAALMGIKGYVLSVWGSDVYDFPQKSILHKCLLGFSLNRAGHLFSTSCAMAEEVRKYTKKHIDITPFGVDMKLFQPRTSPRSDEAFIVGTVKTLEPKYGIEYLLLAVEYVKNNRPDIPIKLRVAGTGNNAKQYRELAEQLGIDRDTVWLGFLAQDEVAKELANMDVAVVASVLDSESFGVSAVEAEACGTALIVSDIPGLLEATAPGESSIVVKRKNYVELGEAIIALYDDPRERKRLGEAGRRFAENRFELDNCFHKAEKLLTAYRVERGYFS